MTKLYIVVVLDDGGNMAAIGFHPSLEAAQAAAAAVQAPFPTVEIYSAALTAEPLE